MAEIFAISRVWVSRLWSEYRLDDESPADCDSILVAGGAVCDFADDVDLAIH
jgi:hypothetical protein